MRNILIALLVLLFSAPAWADQTSGGVNWQDSMSYQKPAFYPITIPSAASVGSNIYYVDQASGSGTTCSEASPCGWSGLSGKAGTTGGPAYIYLQGNARLVLSTQTIYGSSGNQVVVMPWPGNDSTPINMTRVNDTSSNNANLITSSNIHDVIFDGGPNMLFRFIGAGSDYNSYDLIVNSDNVTMYRCVMNANGSSGPSLGIATGYSITTNNFNLINCELYGSHLYLIYAGGGTPCNQTAPTHLYGANIWNNIFRDVYCSGIQIESRGASSDIDISGNAFHDTSTNCTPIGHDRPAIDPASAGCYGTYTNVNVTNNICFDLGGGGIYIDGGNPSIYNNTLYNFNTNGATDTPNNWGIAGSTSGASATVRNNLIVKYTASGYTYNTGGWTQSNNLTDSTGSSYFASTSSSSTDFLKLKAGAPAIDAGYATGLTTDYFGDSRSGTLDVGADEYSTSSSAGAGSCAGGGAGSVGGGGAGAMAGQ